MKFFSPQMRIFWSALLALLVLAWFAKQITLSDLLLVIRESSLVSLLVFFCFSLLMSLLRSWRYQILFAVNGFRAQTWRLFFIVLVRNFCSDLLPARLGSLIFIPLAYKTLGVKISSASASFGAALFLDIAAMIPILLLALLLVVFGLSFDIGWLALMLGVLTALVTLTALLIFPALRLGLYLLRHPWLQKQSFFPKLESFFEDVTNDLKDYVQRGVLVPIFLLSILSRLAKYGALLFLLQAMLPPLGVTLDITLLPGALLGLIAAELSASLPISGIAGFGAYQGTWALVFRMVGFDPSVADVTAISHSVFAQAYGFLMGAAGLGLLFLISRVWPIHTAEPSKSQHRGMRNALLGIVLLTSFVVVGVLVTATQGIAEKSTQIGSPSEDARQSAFSLPPTDILPGGVVFDSRASGRFALYFFDFERQAARQIAHDEQHLQFPVLSDDGRFLAFARTPTTSRIAPSSVLIVDIQSQRVVHEIPDATFPSFFPNTHRIMFERQRSSVWSFDMRTSHTEKLFPNQERWARRFQGRQIVKPRPGASEGEVYFIADVPARWTSWLLDVADRESQLSFTNSCQPVHGFDEKLYVSLANGNTRVRRAVQSDEGNLLTGPPNSVHAQYFPAPAPLGWVLYSAAPSDESSHETGRFDIFIEHPERNEQFQVTSDGRTNRWPKYVEHIEFLRNFEMPRHLSEMTE